MAKEEKKQQAEDQREYRKANSAINDLVRRAKKHGALVSDSTFTEVKSTDGKTITVERNNIAID